MFDGETIKINNFSRCMRITEVRKQVAEKKQVSKERIRMFFGGKQVSNFLFRIFMILSII